MPRSNPSRITYMATASPTMAAQMRGRSIAMTGLAPDVAVQVRIILGREVLAASLECGLLSRHTRSISPSALIPKFAAFCGALVCELQNRDTSRRLQAPRARHHARRTVAASATLLAFPLHGLAGRARSGD